MRASSGRTALHQACLSRHVKIGVLELLIETLLRYGRGIDHKDSVGRTALDYAVSIGSCDKALLLINNGAKITQSAEIISGLHTCSKYGCDGLCLQKLLDMLNEVDLCNQRSREYPHRSQPPEELTSKIVETKSFTWFDVLTSNDTNHLIFALRAFSDETPRENDTYNHSIKIKLYRDVARDRLRSRATKRLRYLYYGTIINKPYQVFPREVIQKILRHLSNE